MQKSNRQVRWWQFGAYLAMAVLSLDRLMSTPHVLAAWKATKDHTWLLLVSSFFWSIAVIETAKRWRRERTQMKEESQLYVS